MDLAHAARTLTLGMPFFFRGRPKERAGAQRLASRRVGLGVVPRLSLSSDAFDHGGWIPSKYTSTDGDNLAPPLCWSGVPEGTRALVLLVEDPDAPTLHPFVHWISVLPAWRRRVLEGENGAGVAGRNSMYRRGWLGCAPPKGDAPHHYHFQLFALGALPKVGDEPGRTELLAALRGRVIGFGELVGRYARPAAQPVTSHAEG